MTHTQTVSLRPDLLIEEPARLVRSSAYKNLRLLIIATLLFLSNFSYAIDYTTNGLGTWVGGLAPRNPLQSGDVVNVNHKGVYFDFGFTVTLQAGSIFNINDGGKIELTHLVIEAGAIVDLGSGGTLGSLGSITNNSDNVTIDGDLTDNDTFTNNGSITGSGNITAASIDTNATGTINGSSMGGVTSPVDLGTLPVDLISFSASYNDNAVLVRWSTATEENNNFFTLERSSDGLNWEQIGTLEGAGNSSYALNYSFYDYGYVMGQSYYRLQQTDYDGKFEVFDAVGINISIGAVSDLSIFPNPVYQNRFIRLSGHQTNDWKLYNVNGIFLKEGNLLSSQGKIYIGDLREGVYFLKTPQTSSKFVIK